MRALSSVRWGRLINTSLVRSLALGLVAGLALATGGQAQAQQKQGYNYDPNAQQMTQQNGQPQGERFYLTIPEGWKEVSRTRQQGAEVFAYVPGWQTVNQWTDMLTVQVFQGMAALPAQAYYERTRSNYQQACAASRAGELQSGMSNGYPSAFWILACGQNVQHKYGETAFFRLVQGDSALYIVQRSWRTAPFDAQTPPPVSSTASEQAVETLKGFGVCDPGLSQHACP